MFAPSKEELICPIFEAELSERPLNSGLFTKFIKKENLWEIFDNRFEKKRFVNKNLVSLKDFQKI